jgi:signal peptidase II
MTEDAPKPARKPRTRKQPPAPEPRPPVLRNVGLIAAVVILLDQALKYIVVHVLRLEVVREIDLLDPWLSLRMAWNQGMNFGLFASDVDVTRWVLIIIALCVCVWIGIWLGRSRPSRFAQISAGLLIGGALGNVIDRVTYGAVADFLNMSLPNWRNPYSFNVADIAIFLGAIGLVLQPPEAKAELQAPAPKPRKPRAKAAPKTEAKAEPVDKTRDEAGK